METQDLLKEVNLGSNKDKRLMYIRRKLSAQQLEKLTKLLMKYKDCLAWSYEKMPGLSREIVEHSLLIKEGYKPYKQSACRFEPSIILQIKNEIKKILKVEFIRERPVKLIEYLILC